MAQPPVGHLMAAILSVLAAEGPCTVRALMEHTPGRAQQHVQAALRRLMRLGQVKRRRHAASLGRGGQVPWVYSITMRGG